MIVCISLYLCFCTLQDYYYVRRLERQNKTVVRLDWTKLELVPSSSGDCVALCKMSWLLYSSMLMIYFSFLFFSQPHQEDHLNITERKTYLQCSMRVNISLSLFNRPIHCSYSYHLWAIRKWYFDVVCFDVLQLH